MAAENQSEPEDAAQTATTLRDTGVLLGYISPDQRTLIEAQAGMQFQRVDSQVDPLLLDDDLDTLPSEVVSEDASTDTLAHYDPVARHLYASPLLRESIGAGPDAQTYGWSILQHEGVHHTRANQEAHIYGKSRLETYVQSMGLVFKNAKVISEDSVPDQVHDYTSSSVQKATADIVFSELVQEGLGLAHQRTALREAAADADLDRAELLAHIDNVGRGAMNAALDHGDPAPIAAQPSHAFADWLYQEWLTEHWTADPLDFAFAFRSKDGGGARPDQVLLGTLQFEPAEVNACDPKQQLKLLAEGASSITGTQYDQIVNPGRSLVDHSASDGTTVPADFDPIDVESQVRLELESGLRSAIEGDSYELVPLVARSYPGVADQKHLWVILDAFQSIQAGSDTGTATQLLISPDIYEWAHGTPAMELAMALWELREQTMLRIIREFRRGIGHEPSTVLGIVQQIQDNNRATVDDVGELIRVESQLAKRVHSQVLEELPGLREEYQWVFDDLQELGLAILQDDTQTVRSYFR